MPKKPEEFKRIEDKFKLSLLQAEKRFVDLEVTVSEMKEKLKDINLDAISALQQRVDDIEDLIMVEQAGIIELKKMLEATSQKLEVPKVDKALTDLQDKVKKIEADLIDLSKEVPKVPLELETRLEKIERDVAAVERAPSPELKGIYTRLKEIEDSVASVRTYAEETSRALERKISEMGELPGKPGVDFDFIKSKLDSLKSSVDILSDEKVGMDMKIAGVEERINILDNKIKEAISQKFMDEVKSNKKGIMLMNSRLDSIERVIKSLNSDLHEMEKTVKKFEGFERLSALGKDVEEKLEKFKFIEDETRRLSTRIEMIYDDLDKRLEVVKSLERGMPKLSEMLTDLSKKVDENKVSLERTVDRDDLGKIINEVEKRRQNLQKDYSEFKNKIISLNNALNELEEKIRPIEYEYKTIKNIFRETNEKMDKLRKEIEEVKKMPVKVTKVEKPEELEKMLESLKNYENRINGISNKIMGINKRLSKIEVDLATKIAEMQSPTSILNTQMAEMIDRLIFLESKMGALESLLRESSKKQPIILE